MAYSGHSSDIAAASLTFKSLISAMSFYWQLTVTKKYDYVLTLCQLVIFNLYLLR